MLGSFSNLVQVYYTGFLCSCPRPSGHGADFGASLGVFCGIASWSVSFRILEHAGVEVAEWGEERGVGEGTWSVDVELESRQSSFGQAVVAIRELVKKENQLMEELTGQLVTTYMYMVDKNYSDLLLLALYIQSAGTYYISCCIMWRCIKW